MTPASREDVWHAMSDLFLDTDVSLHRDSILRVLKASGFDLEARTAATSVVTRMGRI